MTRNNRRTKRIKSNRRKSNRRGSNRRKSKRIKSNRIRSNRRSLKNKRKSLYRRKSYRDKSSKKQMKGGIFLSSKWSIQDMGEPEKHYTTVDLPLSDNNLDINIKEFCKKMKLSKKGNYKLIFVILSQDLNKLYLIKSSDEETYEEGEWIGHSSILPQEERDKYDSHYVYLAGDMLVTEEGEIKKITNQSGHYPMPIDQFKELAQPLFPGINIEKWN